MLKFPILVADIGGTNARFCILENARTKPDEITQVKVADHKDVFLALESSFDASSLSSLETVICAIAGPRNGAGFELTNADWKFDPEQMKSRLKLSRVLLMNDFSAQATAILALSDDGRTSLNKCMPQEGKPKLVIGPGTGLGVANLFEFEGKHFVVPGEGGHIDIGPRTDRETSIWQHLKRQDGRVSAEAVLSGSGLENLYQAMQKADGLGDQFMRAPDISENFHNTDLPNAKAAIELFVTLMGRVAGDLALVNMPAGGVFLAGGIPAKLPHDLYAKCFLPAFVDKAPHQHLMKDLPVYLVHHPNAAIEGLAYFANSFNLVSIGSMVTNQ